MRLEDTKALKPAQWLLFIILYTVVTLVFAYTASYDPAIVIFSSFFGTTFVAFIPGYCLVNLIFPEGKLDFVEVGVLSVALSFSIAGVSGLFLGLSPVGINIHSITYTLSSIVVVLAVLVFLKKMNLLNINLRKLAVKSPAQVKV